VTGKDADQSKCCNDEKKANGTETIVPELFVDLGHEVLAGEVSSKEHHETDAEVNDAKEVSLADFFKGHHLTDH